MKRCLPLLTLLSLSTAALAEEAAYNRVEFQVDATQAAANDQINATLSIELNNGDPAVLADTIAKTLNAATSAATAYLTVHLASGNRQTWPIYTEDGKQPNKLLGWRSHAELQLDSSDFKAASALMAKLQGNMQVSGVSFSVSDAARRQIESALSQQAIAAFRSRAQEIQQAWGAKSYRLVTMNINTGNAAPPRPMMMLAMAKDAGPAQENFSGGNSTITVTVNGTIELVP